MLVVHIGPRKTATTYLQRNFYLRRAELLAKGWLYPVLSAAAYPSSSTTSMRC
jgi:hypothetical protein